MNDRMLELAKEAEWLANRGDHVDVVFMMEKFAELIIKECAQIATSVYFEPGRGMKNFSGRIKQHFGVEE